MCFFFDGTIFEIAVEDIQRFTKNHVFRQLNQDPSLWQAKGTRAKWDLNVALADADLEKHDQCEFEGPAVTAGVEVTYLDGSSFHVRKVAKIQTCNAAHKSGCPILLENERMLSWNDTVSIFGSPRFKLSSFVFDPTHNLPDSDDDILLQSCPATLSPPTRLFTPKSGRLTPTPSPAAKKQKTKTPSSTPSPSTPLTPPSANGKKPKPDEDIEKVLFVMESQYSNECEAQLKKQFTSRCELELKLADERDAHETKLAQERFAMIQQQSEEQSALRERHMQGRLALLRQLAISRQD